MQKIPLSAVPNQNFNIVLNGQNCIFKFMQRGNYLYMNLTNNGNAVCQGSICLVDVNLINYPTKNFDGYLFFSDLTGKHGIPNYKDLGTRYILFFMTEEELNNV